MNNNLNASDKKVIITDVCPRDGLQNICKWIPTDDKKLLIDKLIDAGVSSLEITSFVHPSVIPQMRDAAQIAQYALEKTEGKDIKVIALVPNLHGAKDAFNNGIKNISYVISASAAHNKANINRTPDESINELLDIVDNIPDIQPTLSIATSFGCPFSGAVSYNSIAHLIDLATKNSINNVTLCDTIGVANPLQVKNLLSRIYQDFSDINLGLHMHNTHGMALANIYTGTIAGVNRFETALGGLGGCPFAPGAAGNVPTEDVVNMLDRLGIYTGISQQKLQEALVEIKRILPDTVNSFMSRARNYKEFDFNTVF